MALYFVGVVAPSEINKKVLGWKVYMQKKFGCKVALRSPAHITLVPPFRIAQENEGELAVHLREFSVSQTFLSVQLNGFSSFAPRVIFVRVELSQELASLQKRLEAYLISNNFPIKLSTRPFHPHITIANRDLKKPDYREAFEHFRSKKYSTSFPIAASHLLRSEPDGWQIIGEYPFGK
jgi:2'-5' RNA ligase